MNTNKVRLPSGNVFFFFHLLGSVRSCSEVRSHAASGDSTPASSSWPFWLWPSRRRRRPWPRAAARTSTRSPRPTSSSTRPTSTACSTAPPASPAAAARPPWPASPASRYTFYFGSTGGGVWKTTDAGLNWKNITDGYFGVGSIGAIAVAPSDPERHLRRHRLRLPARQHLRRRRHLQVDRRAARPGSTSDCARPARSPQIRVHPNNPDVALRRGARPHLRPQRGARRLPLEGRRRQLGEGPLHRRARPASTRSLSTSNNPRILLRQRAGASSASPGR